MVEDEHEDAPWRPQGWRFWAVFPGLCFSMLLNGLDTSILSTSLPTIVAELNGGPLYVWTLNGYFLTTAVVQPFAGQAANVFGRKGPMLMALFLFGLGSALCATAKTLEWLVAARVVQGLGGGGIYVMVDTIAADLVPLRARMKYVAIIMAFFTIGTFIGPVVGGAIVQHTSWRWIFWINLPIVALAMILVAVFLRVHHNKQGTLWTRIKSIDYSGNLILTCSVVAILIPLTWGGTTYAWSSWHIIVPLLLGLLGLFILFPLHQRYLASNPMMPLRIYSTRSSALAYTVTFLHGLILSWLSFFLPVYFQVLLEATPLRSGISLLAIVIPLAPSGMIGGFLIAHFGRYKFLILTGFILMSVGIGCFTLFTPHTSTAVWIILQAVVGAGGGLALTATLPAVQGPVAESDVAVATAAWAFCRQFGGIWGAAIPSAIFNSRFGALLPQIPSAELRTLLANGGAYEHATRAFITSLDAESMLKAEVVDVYTACLKRVWQVLIAFAVVAIPLIFFIKDVKLRKHLKTEFGLRVETGDEEAGSLVKQEKHGVLHNQQHQPQRNTFPTWPSPPPVPMDDPESDVGARQSRRPSIRSRSRTSFKRLSLKSVRSVSRPDRQSDRDGDMGTWARNTMLLLNSVGVAQKDDETDEEVDVIDDDDDDEEDDDGGGKKKKSLDFMYFAGQ